MISAGICLFFRNHDVSPPEMAIAVEERGFDSLFVPENTHMPISRRRADPRYIRPLNGFDRLGK